MNRRKDVVVFDLDGTLADISHRLDMVRRPYPDWPGFRKACVNDSPNDWCVDLMKSMHYSGFRVMVVSARDKEVEAETAAWLALNVGNFFELVLVREKGDSTPDWQLKREWLESSGLRDRILFVVDDRQRVVDYWRSAGLVCLQCNAWQEYKKPPKPANEA